MSAKLPEGPAASIVVINYNYGQFLASAIDSALNQTVQDLEVIVVDDGSTDDSRSVIATYGERVRAVLTENRGHVEACNAGFLATRGGVVIFLDADDVLYADCVEQVLAAWRGSASKVQYRLDTIDKDGVDQKMAFPHFGPHLTAEEIHRQSLKHGTYPWTVSTGNAYARGYLAQVMPIDSGAVFKSPDGYLNKLAPLYGEVVPLPKVLGAYRVHGNNAWAQDRSGLNLTGLLRTIKLDTVLDGIFAQNAAAVGTPLTRPTSPVPQQIEGRILMRRLAPSEPPPYAGDTVRSLWPVALRSTLSAPNTTLLGKVFWMGWLTFLLVAPKRLISPMYLNARGQSGRPASFKWLVRVTR